MITASTLTHSSEPDLVDGSLAKTSSITSIATSSSPRHQRLRLLHHSPQLQHQRLHQHLPQVPRLLQVQFLLLLRGRRWCRESVTP